MTSLLDIGDVTRFVTIRGKEIEVKGISALSFFYLLEELPELRAMMSGRETAMRQFTPEDLIRKVPSGVGMIIAAATSDDYQGLDTETKIKVVARAANLNLGEQGRLLKTIWEITFPNGVAEFVEFVEEVMKIMEGGGSTKAQDTSSPEQSKSSAVTDTQKTKSGE